MGNQIYPNLTFSADGTQSHLSPGGEYAVHIAGTWSSGTMSIQWNDGTNAVEFPDGSLTADGGLIVACGSGKVDFVLSGSSSPDLIVTFNKVS